MANTVLKYKGINIGKSISENDYEKVVKEIISSGGQAISNGSSVTDDNGVKLMIDQNS